MSEEQEQQYIDTTNLTKIRIALMVLADVIFDDDHRDSVLVGGVQTRLVQIRTGLEDKLESTT